MMETNNIFKKVINLFLLISKGEENLIKLKQKVLNKCDINPILLFRILDSENKGFITKDDLMNYLSQYNINYSIADIDYLYFFYDKDKDNVLNFNELLNLLIPDTNYFYKMVFKKKYNNKNFDLSESQHREISIDINKNSLKIIQGELNLARNIDEVIQEIKTDITNFSLEDIYLEIKGYSFITFESLKAFFDRYKVKYNDKDIKNIFIRFDNKNINAKINYNQLKIFFDITNTGNNTTREKPLNYNMNSNKDFFKEKMEQKNNHKKNNNKINNFTNCYNKRNNNNSNLYHDYSACNIHSNKNYLKKFENEDINFELNDNKNNDTSNEYSFLFKESNNNNVNIFENQNGNKIKNKIMPKNLSVININYKDYLREKRNESLERSLNKSLSRTSNVSPKKCFNCEKKKSNEQIHKCKKLLNYNKNNYYNIHDKENYNPQNLNKINFNRKNDNNVHPINKGLIQIMNDDDISIKLPARLDRRLVKRRLPERLFPINKNKELCQMNRKISIKNDINNDIKNDIKDCHIYKRVIKTKNIYKMKRNESAENIFDDKEFTFKKGQRYCDLNQDSYNFE